MKKSKLSEQATDYPLVLFTSPDGEVTVPTRLERDTVWLTQAQMAALFDKVRSVITKHIRNASNEREMCEYQYVQFLHIPHGGRP